MGGSADVGYGGFAEAVAAGAKLLYRGRRGVYNGGNDTWKVMR